MKNFIAWLGGIAIVWYFLCIICLGFDVPKDQGPDGIVRADFRTFMEASVTGVAGALATFVGMTLGFSETVRGKNPPAKPPQNPLTLKQEIAAWCYVASILLALGLWFYRGDTMDQAVLNLAKSFLGLLVGVTTVAVNVRN